MQNTSITQFSTINLEGWEKYLPIAGNPEHFHIFQVVNKDKKTEDGKTIRMFLPVTTEISERTNISTRLRPIYDKIISKHTKFSSVYNILYKHSTFSKDAEKLKQKFEQIDQNSDLKLLKQQVEKSISCFQNVSLEDAEKLKQKFEQIDQNSDLKLLKQQVEELTKKANDYIAGLQKLNVIFEEGDEDEYISRKIISYIYKNNIHKNHEFFKDIPVKKEHRNYYLSVKLVYLGKLDRFQSREKYIEIKKMVSQEICNDTDRKWCDRCEKYVSKKNWSAHIKRDIHINGTIRQKGVRKYKCGCGSEITNEKTVITRHNKSKKHLAYISN